VPKKTIKSRILKSRGEVSAGYGKVATPDKLSAAFHKTHLMKYIELQFHEPLDKLIANGTIYEVAKRLGVDYSTVSKWRKIVRESERVVEEVDRILNEL